MATRIPEDMQVESIVLGAVLDTIGVVGYLATRRKSLTALIPCAFGVAFLGLGFAGDPNTLSATVANALAVFGLIGTGRSLVQLVRAPRGPAAGPAVVAKAAMAGACGLFLLFVVAQRVA